MPFCYRLYHFNVSSDIEFPDLSQKEFTSPDIVIKAGKVRPLPEEETADITEASIILQLPEFRFEILGGNEIVYQITSTVSPEYLRPYILASGLGGILHQQGYLVLHGSAINYGGKAVIFCGNSGVGKSNTAGGFLKKGFPLISDDMCPIVWKEGKPVLLNSFMSLKLWPSDIERINLNNEKTHNWNDPEEKARVIANYDRNESHFEILKIYMLESHEGRDIIMEPLSGIQKLRFLVQNTFRYPFVDGTLKAREDLENYARLAESTLLTKASRPKSLETRKELNLRLIEDLRSHSKNSALTKSN